MKRFKKVCEKGQPGRKKIKLGHGYIKLKMFDKDFGMDGWAAWMNWPDGKIVGVIKST